MAALPRHIIPEDPEHDLPTPGSPVDGQGGPELEMFEGMGTTMPGSGLMELYRSWIALGRGDWREAGDPRRNVCCS